MLLLSSGALPATHQEPAGLSSHSVTAGDIVKRFILASGGSDLAKIVAEKRTGTLVRGVSGPVPFEMTTAAAAMFLMISKPASGCTTVLKIKGTSVLAAFILDYRSYVPRMWIIPASEGRYGWFCFGFDENFKIAEGGLNEKELFIARRGSAD